MDRQTIEDKLAIFKSRMSKYSGDTDYNCITEEYAEIYGGEIWSHIDGTLDDSEKRKLIDKALEEDRLVLECAIDICEVLLMRLGDDIDDTEDVKL